MYDCVIVMPIFDFLISSTHKDGATVDWIYTKTCKLPRLEYESREFLKKRLTAIEMYTF